MFYCFTLEIIHIPSIYISLARDSYVVSPIQEGCQVYLSMCQKEEIGHENYPAFFVQISHFSGSQSRNCGFTHLSPTALPCSIDK